MTDSNPATQAPDYSEWSPITEEEAALRVREIESELLAILLRSERGKNVDPHELLWSYYTQLAEVHRIALKASKRRAQNTSGGSS
jgi:hypothetical protein